MAHHDVPLADHGVVYRPRVSRETRRLLLTAAVAVVVLWALAQARFADRALPVANPVQPLLMQITQPATLADLAGEVAGVRSRIDGLIVPLHAPALRFREDLALVTTAVADGAVAALPAELVAYDAGQEVAVIRLPQAATVVPRPWTVQNPERPRYLLAVETFGAALHLRPVFVGSLVAVTTPAWPGELWLLPPHTDVAPGSWLVTTDAQIVGMVSSVGPGTAVVPAALLIAAADRLLSQPVVHAEALAP